MNYFWTIVLLLVLGYGAYALIDQARSDYHQVGCRGLIAIGISGIAIILLGGFLARACGSPYS